MENDVAQVEIAASLRWQGCSPLQLVGDEDAAEQGGVEAGVQDGQLALLGPGVQVAAAAGAPDGQQVAHLEDRKDDKLKEGRRGESVEQRVHHDPCTFQAPLTASRHV